MKVPPSRTPPPPRAPVTPPPRAAAKPAPYDQGQAHVSNPAEVERAAEQAAEQDARNGKPAPEGNTPGGVSS